MTRTHRHGEQHEERGVAGCAWTGPRKPLFGANEEDLRAPGSAVEAPPPLTRQEDTPEALLKRADEGVYEAKAHGRNQVIARAA